MHPTTAERRPTSNPQRVLLVGEDLSSSADCGLSDLPGVRVEAEDDPAVALGRLAAENIDCAVVEHDPPAFDGLEFLGIVREDAPDLPVVLYASGLDEDVVTAALERGATDVVDADETRALLVRRVETALLVGKLRDDARDVRERPTDGTVTLDERLRVRDANDRAENLLDSGGDGILGERVFESVTTADGTSLEEVCRSVLRTGEAASVRANAPALARWFDVRVSPDCGQLQVILTDVTGQERDERSLSLLSDVTGRLVNAESFEDAGKHVEAAMASFLTDGHATVYLFDSEENALRPTTGGAPIDSDERSPVWEAFTDEEVLTVSDSESNGRADDQRTTMASLGGYGMLVVESERPGTFDERTVRLVRLVANITTQALEHLQQETVLAEREWELQQQTYRLERLHQATEKLLGVEKAITRADTRAEVEQMVCEELASTDRFSFVWFGDVDDDRKRVVPRAWGGTERGYLEEVDLSLTVENTEPAVRAVRDRDVVHASSVSHGLREAPWRRELLNRGHQSVLSLPIVYDGTLYGVLTVCANVPDGFDDVSKRVFDEIADATAFGIDTLEGRQALLADSVVELDVRFTDATDRLHRLAGHLDGTVSLEGVVSKTGSEPMLYLSVTDSSAEDVLERLRTSASVCRVESIADRERGGLFVVTVPEPTVVTWLTQAGGAIQELTASPDEMRLGVELPRPADIRDFIDRLQAEYPGAEIVAQRSHERPIGSRETFMARLAELLTDRQLEVLKTAYLNGYFEWPRARTGEEIASFLGITQPTFNNHLRVAERKLFTLLFDDERADSQRE